MNSQDIALEIQKIGTLRYPNEACGFIIKLAKNKSALIEVNNEAINPKTEFLINPAEFLRVEKLGEIIGVWHTHTNGNSEPSEADLAGCEVSGLTWYLLNVSKDQDGSFNYSDLRSFNPNGFLMPYVGRPYIFGTFDCWTLCRDFYKNEFGIDLKDDYPRIEEFWLNGHDYFGEEWEKVGLVSVVGQPFEYGDILFFQTDGSGKASHAAIYVVNEKILHHCTNRLSGRDHYGGYWLKHTVKHLRHKNNVS